MGRYDGEDYDDNSSYGLHNLYGPVLVVNTPLSQEEEMGLEERARILQGSIERQEAELARILSMPQDDFAEGAVLYFDKQFNSGGRTYSYTAMKANGAWYTSGPKKPGPYRWEELLDFLQHGVERVWEVDSYVDISEELGI